MSSDSKRGRLPFEPRQKKKSDPADVSSVKQRAPVKKSQKSAPATSKKPAKRKSPTSRSSRQNSNLSAIPDVVSKRMGRRMAIFCGIPSALGMSSLFIFYWLKVKEVVELPPYLALGVSFGFLALGIFGLSYGLFSSCWDEDRVGNAWGVDEFKLNLGRTREAWRASRKKAKAD
ncbi:PAM68 family protein [Pleurocapsales cyanobacterium LEGE 10410]|nr:PAM68 family protein [Pleurocapsales cyanobacterium LEGE 10410]